MGLAVISKDATEVIGKRSMRLRTTLRREMRALPSPGPSPPAGSAYNVFRYDMRSEETRSAHEKHQACIRHGSGLGRRHVSSAGSHARSE
jgi:hypothetical protein